MPIMEKIIPMIRNKEPLLSDIGIEPNRTNLAQKTSQF